MRLALRHGVAAWVLLKSMSTLGAALSIRFIEPAFNVVPPNFIPPAASGLGRLLGTAWFRADSLWYLKIAEQGYGSSDAAYAFSPAYPLTIRLFGGVIGDEFAAIIVANLATLIGMVALFALVSSLKGKVAGRAAIFGFALYPTAFFLVAPYAESVFFAFGTGALLAAERRRFLLGSVLAGLAALSRPYGALVILPLAAMTFGSWKESWPTIAAPLAAGLGWLAWVGSQVGRPLGALDVPGLWQRQQTFPPVTLVRAITAWVDRIGSAHAPYFTLDIVMMILSLALVVGVLVGFRGPQRVLGWGLAAYGIGVIGVALILPFLPRPLHSMPRFTVSLFPLSPAHSLVTRRLRLPFAVLGAVVLTWASAMFVAGRPIF